MYMCFGCNAWWVVPRVWRPPSKYLEGKFLPEAGLKALGEDLLLGIWESVGANRCFAVL
jgi:hypothetical protein